MRLATTHLIWVSESDTVNSRLLLGRQTMSSDLWHELGQVVGEDEEGDVNGVGQPHQIASKAKFRSLKTKEGRREEKSGQLFSNDKRRTVGSIYDMTKGGHGNDDEVGGHLELQGGEL
jgi:hypothetical protein